MKILWLAKFDGQPWRAEYPLTAGVESLGYTINRCNYLNPERVKRVFLEDDYDCVLLQNGRSFDPKLLRLVHKPIIYFASEADVAVAIPHIEKGGNVTAVLAHSRETFFYCQKRNIPCVRIMNGYDPSIYKFEKLPFRYDVIFTGTMTERRVRLLNVLRGKLPGINFVSLQNLYNEDACRMYNHSRIALHIHAIEQDYLPSRFFETLPTQALFLSSEIKNNWNDKLSSRLCVMYRRGDMTDCADRIYQLLSNEKLRSSLKESALAEAPRHTWQERAKEFDSFIKEYAK